MPIPKPGAEVILNTAIRFSMISADTRCVLIQYLVVFAHTFQLCVQKLKSCHDEELRGLVTGTCHPCPSGAGLGEGGDHAQTPLARRRMSKRQRRPPWHRPRRRRRRQTALAPHHLVLPNPTLCSFATHEKTSPGKCVVAFQATVFLLSPFTPKTRSQTDGRLPPCSSREVALGGWKTARGNLGHFFLLPHDATISQVPRFPLPTSCNKKKNSSHWNHSTNTHTRLPSGST